MQQGPSWPPGPEPRGWRGRGHRRWWLSAGGMSTSPAGGGGGGGGSIGAVGAAGVLSVKGWEEGGRL